MCCAHTMLSAPGDICSPSCGSFPTPSSARSCEIASTVDEVTLSPQTSPRSHTRQLSAAHVKLAFADRVVTVVLAAPAVHDFVPRSQKLAVFIKTQLNGTDTRPAIVTSRVTTTCPVIYRIITAPDVAIVIAPKPQTSSGTPVFDAPEPTSGRRRRAGLVGGACRDFEHRSWAIPR